MNIDRIREDFKILKEGETIYLDSASTSLRPDSVINAMNEYYYKHNANIGRGVYEFSKISSSKYEEAHRKVADFFGVNKEEIIFTKNCTEAINSVAEGLQWKAGDKVVTTLLEHHSNYLPWLRLKEKFGVVFETISPDAEGKLELAKFKEIIDDKTKLVAVTHISNVLGSISPIEEISDIAHRKGALLLVDGAQSAPHLPLKLYGLNCDFFCCSGHKMLGPTGTGILYVKGKYLQEFKPFLIGGGTVVDVSFDNYELINSRDRYESGTANIAGAIGLGYAVDYLNNIGMEEIHAYENMLTARLVGGLSEIKGIKIYGPREIGKRIGVVSFSLDNDISPSALAVTLDKKANIAIRSGHQCCIPLLKYVLNEKNVARASLYLYNTDKEVDTFVNTMKEILGN